MARNGDARARRKRRAGRAMKVAAPAGCRARDRAGQSGAGRNARAVAGRRATGQIGRRATRGHGRQRCRRASDRCARQRGRQADTGAQAVGMFQLIDEPAVGTACFVWKVRVSVSRCASRFSCSCGFECTCSRCCKHIRRRRCLCHHSTGQARRMCHAVRQAQRLRRQQQHGQQPDVQRLQPARARCEARSHFAEVTPKPDAEHAAGKESRPAASRKA